MFKSGYVTIIGRPNVGKSTLMNKIIGEKLSIVSNKPQTTRNNIQAILTKEDYQIIFVDTPGIHKPKHKLGEFMVQIAEDAVRDVDIVIFMTTPNAEIGLGDKYILEQLRDKKVPVFLALNKIDENTQDNVAKTLKSFGEFFNFTEIIPISAYKGKNVDTLINLMVEYLKEGPQFYPGDMIADVQERFVVSEIIREKALRLLSQEVPHGIAIEILSMKKNERGTYHIDANMLCEKDSHKSIIIGKNGDMLKQISTYARLDIEKLLDAKVNLRVWVKVRKEWRDNNFMLKELGYKK